MKYGEAGRVTQEQIQEVPRVPLAMDRNFITQFLTGDTTPSVENIERCKVNGQAMTYFDDGQDGQTIKILGDGVASVVFGATRIKTNTGATKVLAAGKVYTFTRFDNVWVENE